MQPPTRPDVPRWQDVRAACDGLQQAMDAMMDQADFTSFRPGIARAIAQARDEKQRADHPVPTPPRMVVDGDVDRLEAITIDLAPSDVARIILATRV